MATIEIRTKKRSWAERHPIRSAALYFVLTIAFLIFIGTSGIALVTKLSDVLNTDRSSKTDNPQAELLPIPSFDTIPSVTNQSLIRISGTSRSGSMVRVFLNNEPSDTIANANNKFSMSLSLKEGENNIKALTTDSHGNVSRETDVVNITLDTDAPELTINSPEDNSSISGKNNKNLVITGSINEPGSVKVNDRIAIVNSAGQFSISFTLNSGENVFNIVASDTASNQKQETRTVNYSD